ncbi:transposase [Proteinivorax tanatarense]|uniref:Transposase n=1 Tax=Proteinivorax tanatarense TaxID=1260629 RepID=A0AAU7VKY7_9FIRM
MSRKKIRLSNFNYSATGAYFITICTQHKIPYLGNKQTLKKNKFGEIVLRSWIDIEKIYNNTAIDYFVIMPNHIHGIIFLYNDSEENQNKNNIITIIKNFKSYTTNQYGTLVKQDGWKPYKTRLWQRGYYEHVIRNEHSLNKLRNYIINNPLKWKLDRHYV